MDKQGGQGFKSDIDWNSAGRINSGGGIGGMPQKDGITNKLKLFEYLSYLQTMSVQEKNVKHKLDKELFTVGQTMNGFGIGLNAGAFMSLLSVVYVIINFWFTSYTPRIGRLEDFIIVNSWTVAIIFTTMWIGYYSRYVVGALTKKMVVSLYVGKMAASVGIGFVLLIILSGLEPVIIEYSYLFKHGGFFDFINIDIDKFLSNYHNIYVTVGIQMVFASFGAFIMLQFRHLFISGNKINEYEKY